METTIKHKKDAPKKAKASIVTVSDTRTLKNDKSGALIKKLLEKEGHEIVGRIVVKDHQYEIRSDVMKLAKDSDVIILNGGTGISKRDVTIEAVRPFFEKELPGFSTLFTLLSAQEIGSAAMLSRATAGIIKNTAVFCIPGSPNAVSLAVKKLIIPEMGHIMNHVILK
ncbi:molybdenum cofactor biosynthesis protein MoaB [Candidatus Woesearchaeota archaeon]|nr:molybdenum cofactor biosynthesis protein MoaB [Candidatus Woesearchaeota archaeon]